MDSVQGDPKRLLTLKVTREGRTFPITYLPRGESVDASFASTVMKFITAAEAAVRESASAGEKDAQMLVRDTASLLREADAAVRSAQSFAAGRRASSAGIAAPYIAMLASERAGEAAAAASRRAAGWCHLLPARSRRKTARAWSSASPDGGQGRR